MTTVVVVIVVHSAELYAGFGLRNMVTLSAAYSSTFSLNSIRSCHGKQRQPTGD